nr:hypothetical protein [Bacteroidota bacterium]
LALRIDGGSKIQRKFKELIEQQNQLQYELRQTNQILSDVLVYFTPSSGASAFIQRYREATQRKIKMMKNYRQKSVRMDEVFLNKLENLQITIMERYDPMDIQLAVSEIEMELEVLQLVVGIQSIEVSGNLIEDLLTSSERK